MERSITTISPVILLAGLGVLSFSGDPLRADDAFTRGDVNADGQVSISDVLMLRRWLLNFDRAPPCLDAADVNDDGRAWLSDAVNILAVLFPSRGSVCDSLNESGELVRDRCGAIAEPSTTPGSDPTPDQSDWELDCADYDPVVPSESSDTVRLGSIRAVPGETVKIPVFLTNSVEVEAFQLVVGYDPAVFTPTPTHESSGNVNRTPSFEGTILEDLPTGSQGRYAIVEVHPGERAFTMGLITNFIDTGHEISPGEDILVAWIEGRLSTEAEEGTEIALDLLDSGISHMEMRNEFTYRGESRYLGAYPRLVDGVLLIVPDIGFFVRGDANADSAVDLSDAVTILGYLFHGDANVDCKDAADADDSGTLEITDAIVILSHLFSGLGVRIAPPHPSPGDDPTWNDALGDC